MTWVKICATTNLEDALLAIDAGADAIGFVFGPSKRRVTAEIVGPIVSKLPARVEKIGVFLNESPEKIVETVQEAGLTGIQLHGDETPEISQEVAAGTSAKIMKGIHAAGTLSSDLATWSKESSVSGLLLDSGNGRQGGGTGATFDWDKAAEALQVLSSSTRLVIAGGLNSENVAAAIAKFHPWGVDVASGVESVPGKKDPQKLRAFIAAVRSAHR